MFLKVPASRVSSKPHAYGEMRMSSIVLCGFSRASSSASYDNGGWNTVQVNWKRFSTESYLITSIGGTGGEVLGSELEDVEGMWNLK